MNHDTPFDGDITSEATFEEMLAHLLTAAERNGIDPRGSWMHRSDDAALTDWEAMFVELEHSDA